MAVEVERIVPAVEGDRFTDQGKRYTVKAPCDSKDQGRWFCITHKQAFRNNFEKDGHISEHGPYGKVRHKLVWVCLIHGPEQP